MYSAQTYNSPLINKAWMFEFDKPEVITDKFSGGNNISYKTYDVKIHKILTF